MWKRLVLPLLPHEIHLFTHVQEWEEEVWGLLVSLPAPLPVHGGHRMGYHRHLQLSINRSTKGWHVLGQLLTTTSLAGQGWWCAPTCGHWPGCGLASHHTQPTFCSQHQPSSWLWTRDSLVSAYKTLWGKQDLTVLDQHQHRYDPSVPTPTVHIILNQSESILSPCLLPALAACFFWLPCVSTACGAATSELICLVAHFSARLAGWPASPCGSTAASLAQWWWQECTARNRAGWDGTGKQDCPFWQPGRAGLAWTSHEKLLLIFPLVNTNNSLLMGKLCSSIVFQNHSNHSIFLQIITELSVLSK